MGEQDGYDDVRRWLAGVEVTPPRWSAGEFVRQGRVRARQRAAVYASVASVVLVLAAVPAAGQVWQRVGGPVMTPYPDPAASGGQPGEVNCVAVDLPVQASLLDDVDPVPGVIVLAMDPSGRYQVGEVDWPVNTMVVWEDGEPSVIRFPFRTWLEGVFVNEHGDVVGTALPAEDSAARHGWRYRDGEVTAIPGTEGSEIRGLSADGYVLGVELAGRVGVGDFDLPTTRGFVVSPDGDRRPLTNPDGADVDHVAMTSDGLVIGNVVGGAGDVGSYVWEPDGSVRALPQSLDPHVDRPGRAAAGAWALGSAVAESRADIQLMVSVRVDLRTGNGHELYGPRLDAAVSDGWPILATSVNPRGDVVVEDAGPDGPILLTGDGQEVLLPTPGGTWAVTAGISDDGSVIAGAIGEPDEAPLRPVRWECAR